MIYDLCLFDIKNNIEYRSLLCNKDYTIGRSIKNDIVILDRDVPEKWYDIIKQESKYLLKPYDTSFKLPKYKLSIQFSRCLYTLGLIALFICSLLFNYSFHKLKKNTTIKPKQYLPVKSALGQLKNTDLESLKRVKLYFRIKHPLQAILLNLSTGNILDHKELKIFINNKLIAYAETSINKWSKEQRISITADDLIVGENELVFEIDRSQNTNKIWGVRGIYIQEKKNVGLSQKNLINIASYLKLFLVKTKFEKEDFLRVEKLVGEYKKFKKNNEGTVAEKKTIDSMILKIKQKKEVFFKKNRLLSIRRDHFNSGSMENE